MGMGPRINIELSCVRIVRRAAVLKFLLFHSRRGGHVSAVQIRLELLLQ